MLGSGTPAARPARARQTGITVDGQNRWRGRAKSIDGTTVHLYLVRHCQSTGQEPDAPLTALGREQSEHLADVLQEHGIARIVSSSYARARQTADPLARRLGLSVETDKRLIERVLSSEPLNDWRNRLQAAWEDHDLVL